MQDGHQATMKVFDKAGAKVFKPTVATDVSPRISLIQQPLGPQLNKEVGRDSCNDPTFSQEHPQARVSETEVTKLCVDRDITVRT